MICVSVCTCLCKYRHAYGGQRTTLSISPDLPSCLRRDVLASVTYNKVIGLQMSGNSSVSISHLTTRLQGSQESVTLSFFVCGFWAFELRVMFAW